MTTDQPPKGPEAMRAALRDYVAALHHAYLSVSGDDLRRFAGSRLA